MEAWPVVPVHQPEKPEMGPGLPAPPYLPSVLNLPRSLPLPFLLSPPLTSPPFCPCPHRLHLLFQESRGLVASRCHLPQAREAALKNTAFIHSRRAEDCDQRPRGWGLRKK